MVGGLIFTKLSLNLLGTFTPNWALDSPIALRYLHGYFPLKPLEYAETEAVILVDRLPHPVNTYVDTPMYSIVRIVNGKPVRTLADMIAIIEASTEDFLKIDYYFWTEPTIFKKDDAMASQAQIASLYKMIPQKFAPPSTEERITP